MKKLALPIALVLALFCAAGCDKDNGNGDGDEEETNAGFNADRAEADRIANSTDRTINMFSGEVNNPWLSAERRLRALSEAAILYYSADHIDMDGNPVPNSFPSSMPLTPTEIPCGEEVTPTPEIWQNDGWEALRFFVDDLHRYSYQFESSGTARRATFTITAFGDIDCDGVLSTFRQSGEVNSRGEATWNAVEIFNQEE